MTEAFPVPNPWEAFPPTDQPITKDYVERQGIKYTTICPICYCSVMATDLMEKHLEWHRQMLRYLGQR